MTTLSRTSVTNGRKELLGIGLWLAERGVYIPIPISHSAQVDDSQTERPPEVQANVGSLYRSTGSLLGRSNGSSAAEDEYKGTRRIRTLSLVQSSSQGEPDIANDDQSPEDINCS